MMLINLRRRDVPKRAEASASKACIDGLRAARGKWCEAMKPLPATPELLSVAERVVWFKGMRQRNYRVDRDGGLAYRRTAAQAVGVSSASC